MGAVDRIAGLESDNPLPATVGEGLLRLGRGEITTLEGLFVIRQRIDLDRTGDAAGAFLVDCRDAGMLEVIGQVDRLLAVAGSQEP